MALSTLFLLPLAGLGLLLARPQLDVTWEHHPSHFWLVLSVALINVLLGLLTSEAASRRADTRLFLVSLALLASAGFLGLHALATPGVLLTAPNAGFVIATPVGLLLAAFFAGASALELDDLRTAVFRRRQTALRVGLALLFVAWAAASLGGLPLLKRPPPEEAPATIRAFTPLGLALYGFAAFRYAGIYRRRRRPLPFAVAVAFVLLAEAMIAVAFGRRWHATWWEWHVLMAIAFGAISAGARAEYRRERSLTAAFGGLYLEGTLERIDRRYSDALGHLVDALRRDQPVGRVLDRFRREGFSAEEVDLLERSARELRRVDDLFRPYVGPHLAQRLEAQPELARLGGREADVSVLFADLAGFTAFSEMRQPAEVVEMLNAYWAAAVPVVTQREGGFIERFAGDAIMVVFNAVGDQPDHALRAARAALSLREEAERLAAGHPDWPRFRIGVNSGPAVVGNVGAGGHRSFSVIGDTTNVAARIQSAARPGQVLLGPATYEQLREAAIVKSLGPVELKGKRGPIELYMLEEIRAP
ncbi:MAG TPA: adenylate/guanylate cyclase domain-containing protein [Actinomycetota bacterium]